MKTSIIFLLVMLLSTFVTFSQEEITPQFFKTTKSLALTHYADYSPVFNSQVENQALSLNKPYDILPRPDKLMGAFWDYIALKASIDVAKTKYGDGYYTIDPFACFDIEAIIALAEELLPNPYDTNGQNSFLNAEDAAKSKNFFQLRTGLRLHGRGDVQKADNGDTYKTYIYYLALPVYLLYNHRATNGNDKFFAGLGPYYGYGLFGKFIDKVNGETTKEKIKFGKNESGFKHGDLGLGFVAGYVYGKILFQLSYDLGLSNIGFDKDAKAFNRAFGFSVGYVLK
jgi:hypothetical protein